MVAFGPFRALRQSVIQRQLSYGVQSAGGAICRSRLLTLTTTLRQLGRHIWDLAMSHQHCTPAAACHDP